MTLFIRGNKGCVMDLQEKGFDYIREAMNSNQELAEAQLSMTGRKFLIVPDTKWLKTFNQWVREKHPELIEQLQEEAYNQEDSWIDYLTNREWGFEDEYYLCSVCGGVIRTTPGSAFWKQEYYQDFEACMIVCGDCVRANQKEKESYVKWLLENPERANTILSQEDLETMGFRQHFKQDKCSCIGRTPDNPVEVLKELQETEEGKEYIFSIVSSTPFETWWNVWERKFHERD